MNKDELIQAIVGKTSLAKKDVESVFSALIEEITTQLQKGQKVAISGFGIFRVSERAARTGINPRNPSEKIQIPATKTPKFKAGKTLKDAVK